MAKGNPILGLASGKLGDIVLYRKYGEQISRARVRRIGNPRSELQVLQRVVLSTVTKAYSLVAPLSDHAFQGNEGKVDNMKAFMKVNIDSMNRRVADAGGEYLGLGNFNELGQVGTLKNDYVISQGTLPNVPFNATESGISINRNFRSSTYAEVIDALGLKAGDQLTFVVLKGSDGVADTIEYCRVILAPSSGDMSAPFADGDTGLINLPNPRNQLNGFTIAFGTSAVTINPSNTTGVMGSAIIVSRREDDKWMRSTSQIVWTTNEVQFPLSLALYSYSKDTKSSLYLNQAQGRR